MRAAGPRFPCTLCVPARAAQPAYTPNTSPDAPYAEGWVLYERSKDGGWRHILRVWVCPTCVREVAPEAFEQHLGEFREWIGLVPPPRTQWREHWSAPEPSEPLPMFRAEPIPELELDNSDDEPFSPLRIAKPKASSPMRRPQTTEGYARELMGVELTREMGRGAMGLVFETIDALGRVRALKVLSPHDRLTPQDERRFRREASLLQLMDHPLIVRVHAYREASGFHCFLMDYVDGVSLEQVLRAGPMPLSRVLSLGEQLCEALAYAHGLGVVHRDVKPANVMIDRDERLRLVDFGISKVSGSGPGLGTLTARGRVHGTPDYMAPERLSDAEVDARADLFAVGLVLHEAASGELPALDTATGTIVLKAMHPGLDAVVAKATQREPAARYADAEAMGRALSAVREGL